MNIYEVYLIFSNLIFIIPVVLFLIMKDYLVAISFSGLFVASSIFHTCYIPLHVISNTHYDFFDYCPIGNTPRYGIVAMFFDYFFSTMTSLFVFMFLLPRFNKSKLHHIKYRNIVIFIGSSMVMFIAIQVGFFPPVNGSIEPVGNIANLIDKFEISKSSPIWTTIINYTNAITHLSKSTYITIFTFIYVIFIYVVYTIMYLHDYHFDETQYYRDHMNVYKNWYQKLGEFYTKTYYIIPFLISLFFAIKAFVLWLGVQYLYPQYYPATHGTWHIDLGLAVIIFAFSFKNSRLRRLCCMCNAHNKSDHK